MMRSMSSASHGPGFEDEGIPSFLFNFDQFEKMDDAGVFADQDGRVELIEGRLIHMAPPGADHSNVTSDLMVDLAVALRGSGIKGLKVLSQGTVKIEEHSGPEPDVFVARVAPGRKYYQAEDAVLVVEVSVTTLRLDRSVKRPMYARAGIAEYWIVEPEARSIHVHRQPNSDGSWGEEFTVTGGAVSPLFAPRIAIALDDVFQSL